MQGNDNIQNIDLKYYWGVLRRKRYLALAVGLGVLSVFTLGSFVIPKTYESSATVYIKGTSLVNPLLQGVGVSVTLEERLRNLRNTLTSRSLLERVIKKLNLDANVKNPTQYEALIESLRKNLTVNVRGGGASASDLFFTIAYRGSNPKRVTDLVNTHIQECVSINASSRTQDASGAYSFIEKELNEYREKLEASDKLIREFREQHPTMVPQTESVMVGRIEGFQTGKIDAEIRLRELEKRRESLRRQLAGEQELTVAFVSGGNSPQSRLDSLNSQLMLLLTKFTDDHPEVLKVRSEIEELQQQIGQAMSGQANKPSAGMGSEMRALNPVYRQIKEELARTDTEIDTLRARQGELIRQMHEGQTQLRKMPKDQEEWAKIQRNRSVYQRIYDDLLNKLESARVSRDLELGQNTVFNVMDPPVEPHLPIWPNRIKMIFAGLVLGVLGGIGLVFLLDFFQHTFKNEDMLERRVNYPLLASIPEIVTDDDKTAILELDRKYFKATIVYLSVIGLLFAEAVLKQLFGINILPL